MSRAPLSVVLLISAPAWRGSGTSFGKIAAGLGRAGHRPLLLTAADEVTARFVAAGLPVAQLALSQTGLREVLAVRRALRQVGADAVVADTPRDLRLGLLATVGRPTRVIFRYNLSGRALAEDPASRLLWGRTAAIVFQSAYARDRAHRTSPWLAGWPSALIANGYDDAPVREGGAREAFRARHGIPASAPVVLSAAALFLDKGHRTAMEALARIRDPLPVQYLVCGAGADRPTLEREAARLDLPVRWLGQLDATELAQAFVAADVVLHPAPGELFPNVVAEAMLAGRPVVGVDAGAIPELLGRDERAGVLVPPGDPAAMAAALADLLADHDRRAALGSAARERIREHFPLERMERGYVELVESVVRTA